jgi:type IV pilus assembly protein PilX
MYKAISVPAPQRGVVMLIALILLLVLTLLGVALARMQTVEERLARNDVNHQMALQTAEAALQGAFDDDADGIYTDWTGSTIGLNSLANELPGTSIGYSTTWTPGTDSIAYNGSTLANAPAAANPAFRIEQLTPVTPPGCQTGNSGNYGVGGTTVHRITAHSLGGDGSASATVQTLHIGGC